MPPDRRDALSSQLPGTWRLESRIDVTASGERRPEVLLGEDPIALLIHDRSGHFAYFGTFTVDNERGTVTDVTRTLTWRRVG